MPPLENPRHERFAQALFEGKTADEAYVHAGYKPNDGNCIRLKGNERVKSRLAELQAQAAKASEVTVASLLAELEAARARADSLEQLSAAVKAIDLKAKVSGLLVNRVEVGAAGAFDECETPEQIFDVLAEADGFRLGEPERIHLANLITEAMDFLANCKPATMVIECNSPADIRDREARAQRRLRLPPPPVNIE
jgi:phage terminase small subunit